MPLKSPSCKAPNGGSGLELEALHHICSASEEQCGNHSVCAIDGSMNLTIGDVRESNAVKLPCELLADVAMLASTAEEDFACLRVLHYIKVSTFSSHHLRSWHPIVNN